MLVIARFMRPTQLDHPDKPGDDNAPFRLQVGLCLKRPQSPIFPESAKSPPDYSGAMVSLMPSSSGAQVIWQDSREFGSTAIAMSSMSVSASDFAGRRPYHSGSTYT